MGEPEERRRRAVKSATKARPRAAMGGERRAPRRSAARCNVGALIDDECNGGAPHRPHIRKSADVHSSPFKTITLYHSDRRPKPSTRLSTWSPLRLVRPRAPTPLTPTTGTPPVPLRHHRRSTLGERTAADALICRQGCATTTPLRPLCDCLSR